MKFYVETFGCQMNVADGLEMGRRLKARGFEATTDPALADVVLVNTCTVRQHAEDKALSRLGRLADWRAGGRRLLVMAGCAAERLGPRLSRRFPQVDLVIGAKSIARFDEILDERWPRTAFDGRREWEEAWGWGAGLDDTTLPGEGVAGFVTIMRGCNFSCSYCVVPAVRGREVYRPALSVLDEAAARAARGQWELTLLGQTVNSYRPGGPNPGRDGADINDFSDLLRALSALPGVERLRFMSPHPQYIDDKFAAVFAETPAIAPHLHLPVQSGSDAVLSRMRRNHTRAKYLEKTRLLRTARPEMSLTTDFIVGFPGETEDDFESTVSLVGEADLDGAYVFKYSPRPGTASAGSADDVPPAEKERRHAALQALLDERARAKLAALAGTIQDVLVEAVLPADAGWEWETRTAHNRKMFVRADRAARPGERRRVRVTGAEGKTLYGDPT
ncbi:MAG: tRNA (N6-isopentenyl adenosine(37)-C2)-methylthiotransferase MiaB [Elusimicrobia bacterium]|nr:tRNA (N6-isopentenyl adenosine(37)-C2)-methylthiotransferase MiaB [Elusimicrobiota bacterium]MBK8423679.1 tRNA (N6-isopentenyl adenosine(37)-C2)-methylthiotransferase MiaB [Elusimicrobiota bacterium]MBK8650579.1 tRNA (N6-isopentenyl adenosine(37)-C2)-methylthiotransferase MiaB [Elusimicrobiota bacterium]MBP8005196.1 tRNA (N6-isopentenyl adenosine(37)-C2)-methylthiotransferase MiaB [Elusimicrobiota bacterium]